MVVRVIVIRVAIPQVLNLLHGFRLPAVQLLQKMGINFLAVAVFTAWRNLQRLIEHIFLAGENIHEISKFLGIIGRTVNVNMDAAAVLRTGYAASLSQRTHNLLKLWDILIFQNRRDHLNGVMRIESGVSVVIHLVNAAVVNNFPSAPFGIRYIVAVIAAAVVVIVRVK